MSARDLCRGDQQPDRPHRVDHRPKQSRQARFLQMHSLSLVKAV